MDIFNDVVVPLAGSPWAYAVLAAFLLIDGFFPFVPGETLVVALAVLSAGPHGPNLWIVLTVALIATTVCDAIAFAIGRRIGLTRWSWMRRRRTVAVLDWARRRLRNSPAMLMLTAKFVPVGRVAVTMSAGATGFPIHRYIPLALTASATYTAYHVAVGFMAGTWLSSNPLAAVLAAMGCVLVLGFLIDVATRRWRKREQLAIA